MNTAKSNSTDVFVQDPSAKNRDIDRYLDHSGQYSHPHAPLRRRTKSSLFVDYSLCCADCQLEDVSNNLTVFSIDRERRHLYFRQITDFPPFVSLVFRLAEKPNKNLTYANCLLAATLTDT